MKLRCALTVTNDHFPAADKSFPGTPKMKPLSPELGYLLCAAFCASLGATFDLRTHRIPNALTASSLICGLLFHGATAGWSAMAMASVAGLIGGSIFFIVFAVGGMGAGDIKLMAAVSCIAGFGSLTELFCSTALMGGLFALTLAICHGRLRSTLVNVGAIIEHHAIAGLQPHPELHLHNSQTLRLPYGLAIAAGCWITFLSHMLR